MPEEDEVVDTLESVGISDKQIKSVLATTRKTDIDSPDKLYYYLNLADVTSVKKVARAIIGVFGEEGHKFMKKKVEESSNTSRVRQNKKGWNNQMSDMNIDRAINEMIKAAKLKTIMSATGMGPGNNSGNNGGNNQQNQYPMAEEPVFKDGKMLVNENNQPVTRKYPVNPNGNNGGNAQMQMMMKMMEMQNNNNDDDRMFDLFKIVMSEKMGSGDDRMAQMEKELIDAKREVNKKELEQAYGDIENVLSSYGEKLQELENKTDKDVFDELVTAKEKVSRLKEIGFLDGQSEDDWKREKERKKMQMEREMKHKTLDAIKSAAEEVGKPVAEAVGQGMKQNIASKSNEPQTEKEEVDHMLETIRHQKEATKENPDLSTENNVNTGSNSSNKDVDVH